MELGSQSYSTEEILVEYSNLGVGVLGLPYVSTHHYTLVSPLTLEGEIPENLCAFSHVICVQQFHST